MNLSITCLRLAGRVAYFLSNWEVLTQDQWVLQTVVGYHLELTEAPTQERVPHQIRCSPESKSQITSEVQELLSKGAVVETLHSPGNFVSQIFLVEKQDGGQRPVINLKGLNQFVKTEHFKMEGLHLLSDLLKPQDWMARWTCRMHTSKCPSIQIINISSPSNGKRKLTSFSTTFWSISCTQGVYKAVEASSGLSKADWLSSNYLLGRPTDYASGKSSVGTNYPTDLSTIREFRINSQFKKIHTDPHPEVGISGVSVVLNSNESIAPLREDPQDSAGCQTNDASSICFGEGNCTVCGESNCYHEGHPLSPLALPSPADADELSASPELQSGGNFEQVQYCAFTDLSQQRRFGMVANEHLSVDGGSSVLTRTVNDCAFRCIQSGLGSSIEWPAPHRGCVVAGGGNSPHQLPRVAGCLPGNQGFREDLAEHHSPPILGQCNSSELHKSERGHSVQSSVRACDISLDLVHRAKHYPRGRAPSWPTELSSRPGVQDHQGSL